MTAKHEPTEESRNMASTLSGFGVNQADIARSLGISEKTLRNNYRDELDMGLINANARVAQTLFNQATDPENPKSTTAAIFWLKARAGWSERIVVDNTSSDGSMSPSGARKLSEFLDVSKPSGETEGTTES
jgi:transcription initiation factor TFIIIB Brf1 subunit/transcription initiation factor TFIIB